MKLNTLRHLDRLFGIHICNVLYWYKLLFREKRERSGEYFTHPKKILLVKVWGIGSVILLSPVVPNLRKMYPDAEIHFLTKKWLESIYAPGFFDKIYLFEIGWFFSMFRDFSMLIWSIWRERYDIVIDFEIVSRFSAILSFLTWPKFSIGYQIIGQNKDKLYDANVIYHESKHITEIFVEPLKLLGCEDIDYSLVPPFVSEATEKSIHDRFPDLWGSVVVNVNTSDLALERRWPKGYFAEVIDFLVSKGKQVYMIGAPDERGYVRSVYDLVKNQDRVEDISGKLTLPETYAFIKNCQLFISNDSGPLHVAVAFQVPTVSFFWPETPQIYGPKFHSELHKVFFRNRFCSPCISVFRGKNFVCREDTACMKELSPVLVMKHLQEKLEF